MPVSGQDGLYLVPVVVLPKGAKDLRHAGRLKSTMRDEQIRTKIRSLRRIIAPSTLHSSSTTIRACT
jgi:hypothetical protein